MTAPPGGTTGSGVAVVDAASNANLGTVAIPGYSSLQTLALSPDGTRLYVGDYTVAGTDISTLAGELTVVNTGGGNPVPPQPKPPLLQVVTKVLSRVEPAVDNTKKALQKRANAATTHLNTLQASLDSVSNKIGRALQTWNLPALFRVAASVHGVVSDVLEITKRTVGKLPSMFGTAVGVANLGNTIKDLEENLEVALTGGNGDLIKGIRAFVGALVGVAELTTVVAGLLYGGTATAAGVAVVDLFVVGASGVVATIDKALG